MALPPEPLEELLPEIRSVVVAEVVDATPVPEVARPRGSRVPPVGASEGQPIPEQRVRLQVEETLLGAELRVREAVKPEGAYVLVIGVRGPFMLDGSEPHPRILGRYGPDSVSLPKLRAALAEKKGHHANR